MALFFRYIIAINIIFCVASCSKKTQPSVHTSTPPATKETVPVYRGAAMEEAVLYYTNLYRNSKGLTQLTLHKTASEVAYVHSKNMALKKTAFGHAGFEERITIIQSKSGKMAAAAENVAFGQLSAKDVVDGWIKSAPHRKNLEGNYTMMGLGFAKDARGVPYYTQIFLRK